MMAYLIGDLPIVVSEQWVSGTVFIILFFTIVPINSIVIIILTSGALSRLSLGDVVILLYSTFNIMAGFLIPLMTMTLLYQRMTVNIMICYGLQVTEDALLSCSHVLIVFTLCHKWRNLIAHHNYFSMICNGYKTINTPVNILMVVGTATTLVVGTVYGSTAYVGYNNEESSHTLVCLTNIHILHGCKLMNLITGTIELVLCVVVIVCAVVVVSCTMISCVTQPVSGSTAIETNEVNIHNN